MTEDSIQEQVALLSSKNTTTGYAAMNALLALSRKSDVVYPHVEEFFVLLESGNSYLRVRGLLLLAANARWDTEDQITQRFGRILIHITDEKPIAARQCIQALAEIAQWKPKLRKEIAPALEAADFSSYAGSMRCLLEKDRERLLSSMAAE